MQIQEGEGIHRQVGYVSTSSNNGISFSITDGDIDGNFEIDSSTGLISTAKSLDREERSSYDLTVTAVTGSGASRRFQQLPVQVNLKDVNDNAPRLLGAEDISVPQGVPQGYPVFRPQAVDPDQDEALTFELLTSADSTPWLAINSNNGVVTVARNPPTASDSETVATVVVTDKGGLSTSRDYRVRVSAENAHSPTFDFPHSEISVAEDTPPGAVVIQVRSHFYACKC